MKTGLIGDLHCRPGDTLHHQFSRALQEYDRIIDLGDQCEVQVYGIEAWRSEAGHRTIYSIASSVNEMIVITRNHWGLTRWAKELYAPYPYVTVLPEYEFAGDDGRTYWFRHGSEYSEWRAIQPIASLVTLSMTHNPLIRQLWYRWCAHWGYLPPGMLEEPPREIELLTDVISFGIWRNMFGTQGINGVWKKALRDVEKRKDTTLFIAHTHQYCHRKGNNGSELFNIRPRQLVNLTSGR